MKDVKKILQQLEINAHSVDIPTKIKLKKCGYITLKTLDDNNGTVAFATYTGLTEKGKRALNDEN